jgi:YfiH family protein
MESQSAREASDFALFRDGEPKTAGPVWAELARTLGFPRVVGSRQVHGRVILLHEEAAPIDSLEGREPGVPIGERLFVGSEADGHATVEPGILMAVTVADCVPVFFLDPHHRAIVLLHAGWRGVVAGVLEAGLELMERRFGSAPEDLFIHLGPGICGACYEVGAEVHEALGLPRPGQPRPVDLRTILLEKATARDVRSQRVTASALCTRCPPSPFFSHRGGDVERQVGYLGIRSQA